MTMPVTNWNKYLTGWQQRIASGRRNVPCQFQLRCIHREEGENCLADENGDPIRDALDFNNLVCPDVFQQYISAPPNPNAYTQKKKLSSQILGSKKQEFSDISISSQLCLYSNESREWTSAVGFLIMYFKCFSHVSFLRVRCTWLHVNIASGNGSVTSHYMKQSWPNYMTSWPVSCATMT